LSQFLCVNASHRKYALSRVLFNSPYVSLSSNFCQSVKCMQELQVRAAVQAGRRPKHTVRWCVQQDAMRPQVNHVSPDQHLCTWPMSHSEMVGGVIQKAKKTRLFPCVRSANPLHKGDQTLRP
jgi:hypothetical protein